MCLCNSKIRTPFCGAVGCEWPSQEHRKCVVCNQPGKVCGYVSNEICTTVVCEQHRHKHLSETKVELIQLHIVDYERLFDSIRNLRKDNEILRNDLENQMKLNSKIMNKLGRVHSSLSNLLDFNEE